MHNCLKMMQIVARRRFTPTFNQVICTPLWKNTWIFLLPESLKVMQDFAERQNETWTEKVLGICFHGIAQAMLWEMLWIFQRKNAYYLFSGLNAFHLKMCWQYAVKQISCILFLLLRQAFVRSQNFQSQNSSHKKQSLFVSMVLCVMTSAKMYKP